MAALAFDPRTLRKEAFMGSSRHADGDRSMHTDELVSVIVPAYNAARTLGDTLDSIRRQTHPHLEIIVVDDGSRDRTAAVAEAHAAEDERIRLVRQENGGVARARNAGAAASRGAYIAPVDADDLWHPDKIARQLTALRAAGPGAGYAYTYFRRIDADGRVIHSAGHRIEGAAFLRSILLNFVGNGSALLIQRAAFESVGGYDPALHDAGLQGCEDYLLQMRIARHWRVVCVAEYLTGYRTVEGAMSADRLRMAHSQCAAFDTLARQEPDAPAELLAAARALTLAQIGVRLGIRLQRGARGVLGAAIANDAHTAARIIAREAIRDARGIIARRVARLFPRPARFRPRFADLAPDQRPHTSDPPPLAGHIAALAVHEETFFTPTAGRTACLPRASAPG